MNSPITLAWVGSLIVVIFYIPLILLTIKRAKQRIGRRYFYRGVYAILEREKDDEQAIEQLHIIYRKTCEIVSGFSQKYISTRDILEDLFMRACSLRPGRLKEIYTIDTNEINLDRLSALITLLKRKDPYGSVSSKHGNLLNMIDNAFTIQNPELGRTSLRQLADDVEILESTITQQERRNTLSMIVSIVGVILTIVFGALSVVQYLESFRSSATPPKTEQGAGANG